MNILILHAHWNNRGDEAALRAMVDELIERLPDCKIKVLLHTNKVQQFYATEQITAEALSYPTQNKYCTYSDYLVFLLSKGRFILSKEGKYFRHLLKETDIVIHGPGGPSIGDVYDNAEKSYLYRLLMAKLMKKPYVFYAPSMGPFKKKKRFFRNILRRMILNGSSIFCLREPLSKQYVMEFGGVKEPTVTLDSAFQHDVDVEKYKKILEEYVELNDFINSNTKIIGITTTDLMWNPKYRGNTSLKQNIYDSFKSMVNYLLENGYAVLFIPQLFGRDHDNQYMQQFASNDCFVMSDEYDCYFQQFVISKMYALIGMRYHSNIFSAKMGRPFVSVAYEQKMSGFMEKINLTQYCIKIDDLSFETLRGKFEMLVNNYDEYESYLESKTIEFKNESAKTTDILVEFIKSFTQGK